MSSDEERGDPRASSSILKRVVGDRLSRSLATGKERPGVSPAPSSRVMSRLGKAKQASDDRPSSQSASMLDSARFGRRMSAAADESPFIRPLSPTASTATTTPRGNSGVAWDGFASTRAGTQTLIQALQAIPWADDVENEDEALHEASIAGKAILESDEEEDVEPPLPMFSSIHTIHRPVARSKRTSVPKEFRASVAPSEVSLLEEGVTSPSLQTERVEDIDLHASTSDMSRGEQGEDVATRGGTPVSGKTKKRAALSGKLRDIFEVPSIEEVVAEIPCYLFRSILLQGFMYLTNSHLCFFAHIPNKEDHVLKSGFISKKATRTRRWIKHWFILKNDTLSWYQSSTDPYFPHGVVNLRYALSCEPAHEKDIRIRTNQKNISLSAESIASRDEWVKAIRRVMFKAQHTGDSVKVAIPYSAVLEVERSAALEDMIEVRVVDAAGRSVGDTYLFAHFTDRDAALKQIRTAVRAHSGSEQPRLVKDTTQPPRAPSNEPPPPPARPALGAFRLSSFWQRSGSTTTAPSAMPAVREQQPEEFTHISTRREGTFVPITTPEGGAPVEPTLTDSSHTYPPSPTPSETLGGAPSALSTWGVGVPSWLRVTRPGAAHRSTSGMANAGSTSEVPAHERGYSVLETPAVPVDLEMQDKFRSYFALGEEEVLLGYFPGFIYRLVPLPGRLYVSTNFFCFKTTGPLSMKTRMIIPIRDILSTEPGQPWVLGRYGLVINLRGHEELFFEFAYEERRGVFARLLDHQLGLVPAPGPGAEPEPELRAAHIFDDFEPGSTASVSASASSDLEHSALDPMFTSASSTFLRIKPEKPLHFTFLTIGSRGDVQPYIALAKGLMAEGHRCRIATHGEFKDWIEGQGLEYGYVGGDPAELMKLSVDNGMFTVSFLKEGLTKFRGWIDDLLKTSWEACQGTDVLVESPSAMSGYHIAEALQIPYFRAFTMTWTRTRAYPHAFAIPDYKRGGSYNYMTYVLFDQVFWRAIAGQINRWRRKTLNLGSTSLDLMEPHKIPFLYNFSPTVVPPPLDWPDWIRITGYWFLDSAEVSKAAWTPPVEVVRFIDEAHAAGKKVVYIGFGSIVVSDPHGMTKVIVEAIKRSGVYAILSKGWSDRLQAKGGEAEPEVPLPKQVLPISSIPHDWLFQRIDAACHHGGAGTTGASLRAGIPIVIKPFFGDQFFWADRVEALGIGSGVRNLTVEALTDALISATTDIKQVERARAIGAQIRSENGVANAIQALYRDLDYARSLIKVKAAGQNAENATIREAPGDDANASDSPLPDSDWSVIEDSDDDSDDSHSPRHAVPAELEGRPGVTIPQRPSLVANVTHAVSSVLPGTRKNPS